jgi:hypothetical protein
MNVAKWFTSPPPATGWSLDPAMAAVVRRGSKGELQCAATQFPERTFEVGPVGLQSVDPERMRPVLSRLQEEVDGAKRAAVVVPTGWLRSHLIDFDELPRRQADIHDVVQWRLKKLLPVPPSSLRLATVAQPPSEDRRRLLVLVGVERAMAGLEEVFLSVGVSPSLITPRIFAVADSVDTASPVVTIQQEKGFLSLMLLISDVPHLLRTKPLPEDDWGIVERELALTTGFIRSNLGIEERLTVEVSVESEMLGDRLQGWIAEADGLSAAPTQQREIAFDGTAVSDRVGSFRLDPVTNVMAGGVR